MHAIVGPRAGRARARSARLCAAAVCALGLMLAGCGGTVHAATASPGGRAYTLMQMNLCLSGLASCYYRVDYPAGIGNVVTRIRQARPDAVTFNEACSGDVAQIARQTGYHMRFSTVIYGGKILPCVKPGGRGLFGDAVLTRAAIVSSANQAYAAQMGPEHRRWLCVSTRVGAQGVQVCTSHLASADPDEVAANKPQCTELTALLARRAAAGTLIFAGDVNRRSSCAPRGFWTASDAAGHEDAGSQQAYGTGALHSPSVQLVPTPYTDHEELLVHARLG